jgi:hypothetical protein
VRRINLASSASKSGQDVRCNGFTCSCRVVLQQSGWGMTTRNERQDAAKIILLPAFTSAKIWASIVFFSLAT